MHLVGAFILQMKEQVSIALNIIQCLIYSANLKMLHISNCCALIDSMIHDDFFSHPIALNIVVKIMQVPAGY